MDRAFGWVLPGWSYLTKGDWLRGLLFLISWISLLLLVGLRLDRVAASWTGGVWEQVALGFLLSLIFGVWFLPRLPGSPRTRPEFSPGPAARLWSGFTKNWSAVAGLIVICLLYSAMFLAPFIAPEGTEYGSAVLGEEGLARQSLPPGWGHPLGTDHQSRDLLSGLLYGARISLSIGLLAVAISVTIGTTLGAVAAYWGGWIDTIIMRSVDVVMAFPRLVLLIAIVAIFQPNIFTIIAALAFTQWPLTTRLVRGEILALKEREFAEAARALGFSRRRILFKHLLPNAFGPLVVVATLGIGNTIILEAALSFLDLGVPAGVPSWGKLVAEGRTHLSSAWWITTFPGLTIVLAVLAFNLVGDGLRDALDPRQGQRGRR